MLGTIVVVTGIISLIGAILYAIFGKGNCK